MILSAFFDHLPPVLLILTRLSGLVAFAPVFGSNAVPVRVKFALIFMISLILHFGFSIGFQYRQPDANLIVLEILKEFAVGAGMGVVILVLFSGIAYAGSIIAPQMGLAISQLVDPQTRSMMPLLSTVLNIIAVTFFLAIDGHLMLLRAFVDSYRLLPLGDAAITNGFVMYLVKTASQMFVIALKISAPVLAVILFINTGMAIMARVVPQVNVIVVGFIITISAGIVTLALTLPYMLPYWTEFLTDAVGQMLWLLKAG